MKVPMVGRDRRILRQLGRKDGMLSSCNDTQKPVLMRVQEVTPTINASFYNTSLVTGHLAAPSKTFSISFITKENGPIQKEHHKF
jgi:hypothetical protein